MTELLFEPAPLATLEAYDELERELAELAATDRESYLYNLRAQCEVDLYALMRFVLTTGAAHNCFPDGTRYIEHRWSYEMARCAQYDHDGVMTMAGRGHGKSITFDFGLGIFLYIKTPTSSTCIWSVTRALAKSHLRAKRNEFENNHLLAETWPDRFWAGKPRIQASSWSLDEGLAMPQLPPSRNEMSFEAWGLVDQAFPTGKHFDVMIFDDVVDERCITSPEMIAASRQTHDMAGGVEMPGGCKRIYIGTPYADGDTGVQLIEEGVVRLRARPAVDPKRQDTEVRKKLGGAPVFLTEKQMLKKLATMGQNYYSQMLLDPNKGRRGTLDVEQLRYYETDPDEERLGKNVYLCVDPNGGFDPTANDPMAMTVWGLGGDRNFYLLDAWLGHLDPGARHDLIVAKRAQWMPLEVRIEEMTIGSDSYWLREAQERTGHRFEVASIRVETMRAGTARGTWTRVQRLTEAWQPTLDQNRLYLPRHLWVDIDGERVDLADAFREELRRFPIATSDNLISSGALLFADHGGKRGANPLIWPDPTTRTTRHYPHLFNSDYRPDPGPRGWMGVG